MLVASILADLCGARHGARVALLHLRHLFFWLAVLVPKPNKPHAPQLLMTTTTPRLDTAKATHVKGKRGQGCRQAWSDGTMI